MSDSEMAPEVAHVLFMDVVSYSLLPMDHQSAVIAELQALVSALPEFRKAQTASQLICLPTGDGMALAFFGDPTSPLRCARQIAANVRGRERLQLRMGIHTGPVYRISDINANRNIAGGGINYAQRVMDCGDSGHVLVSKAAADMLAQLSAFEPLLHDVGEIEVKHGVRVHVYNAFADDFGNAGRPSKAGLATSLSNPPNRPAATANPFDPWKPVVPPTFVGRTKELRRLQAAFDEGRSVSLVGDWRIGKSSVLKTCLASLEQAGRTARLLSGEGREGASPALFVECATGEKGADGADQAADILSAWAREAYRPGIVPALLVDEFDTLVLRFDPRFLERLRGMLDYLCLVVSSRRELDRVYKDLGRTSPFHNRLELCWLGLLDAQDAETLLRRSRDLPAEAYDLVREWAGRHPFFIQLFCRKLVDGLRYDESLDSVREQFLVEGGGRLRELWTTLSEGDRKTLQAATHTPQPKAVWLKHRGLLTEAGRPFGRLLVEWLQDDVGRTGG